MFIYLSFFATFSLSIDQSAPESDEELQDSENLMKPSILSDFLTARQSRNITMHGKKENGIINGQFFRKPLVNLLQSAQPCVINLRQMYFESFDGIILKGEGVGLARFPDIVLRECSFNKHNQHPIHVHGSSTSDAFDEALIGDGNIMN